MFDTSFRYSSILHDMETFWLVPKALRFYTQSAVDIQTGDKLKENLNA